MIYAVSDWLNETFGDSKRPVDWTVVTLTRAQIIYIWFWNIIYEDYAYTTPDRFKNGAKK